MVGRPPSADPNHVDEMIWTRMPKGIRRKGGRRVVEIRFSERLFDQIRGEAELRQWSFSQMVRHLCEASIDGIE